MSELRNLPAVDQLLNLPEVAELIQLYGRPLVLDAVRTALAAARNAYREGRQLPTVTELVNQSHQQIKQWLCPTLMPVINATGVILHTNLGRAPLSRAAIKAIEATASSYNTLEFDLESGKRGSRSIHAEALLTHLTGAEAALVVNNNAAAVLLALSALARRKRVIISRTQLVEIGGGFRIPEVMAQSGARLIEVGTTNRVHLHDYENALQEPTGLVMRAHHSNFKIIGFTSEPGLEELTAAAHQAGTILLDDLGSGTLLDTARFGLIHEPTIQESLQAGADVVTFSGDKLLGGPQAGILLGRRDLVAKIKKHPFARAVRADKLQLAALAATLEHYLKDEALREIPVWRMISVPAETLRERAYSWCDRLGTGKVIATQSTIGGGSLPEEVLPTHALALDISRPDRFLAALRKLEPAVIARVEENQVIFDPRTVLPEQDDLLLAVLQRVIEQQRL